MPQVIYLGLPEISCWNCVIPIENTLNQCTSPTILSFNTNFVEKKIRIVVNDSRPREEIIQQIREMLEEIGTPTTVITQVSETTTPGAFRTHLIQGVGGLFSGAAFIALSLSGLVLPFSAMCILTILSTGLTLYLGRSAYRETVNTFKHAGTLTMDTLFSISTLIAMTFSIAGLFVPWLPVMPAASLLIFGFRHVGKALEELILRKMTSDLSFKDRAAKYAEKKIIGGPEEKWEKTLSANLLPGDVIRINPGEILPVNGECLSQQALIDQSFVNGALEVFVPQGTSLSAGIRVLESGTVIRVTECLQDSHLALRDDKLEKALASKAPIENTTHKILQYFVPGILILAVVSAVFTGFFFGPLLALQCATSLMLSACPCTLGLIPSLAMNIGMAKALDKGVLFTDPTALESAANIDAVIFDVKGTLTLGRPAIVEPPKINIDAEKFFAYVAALEEKSTHAVGCEIFRFVTAEEAYNPAYPLTLKPTGETHHAGMSAFINDEYCQLGNSHFTGITLSDNIADANQNSDRIYLTINGQLAGSFLIRDPLREDAISAVDALRKIGKKVYICTGSDEATAQNTAHALNIPPENVFSDCDASTKLNHVQALQKKHKRVSMIGDAGNDALATVKSNIGIAMRSSAGETPTHDHAGAVVLGPFLQPVVAAFAIAEQTIGSIKQNLIISLVYNTVTAAIAGGALLAIGISITPPLGAALMVTQMLIILANQYRIRRQNPVPKIQSIHAEPALTYQRFRDQGLINPHEIAPSVKLSVPELSRTSIDRYPMKHAVSRPRNLSPRLNH